MKKQIEKIEKLKIINTLQKGDIFGEIAMLSTLKRTCTVIASGYMSVQCLSRNSLKTIEANAPNVYNELINRLDTYND
jgi:CRP-like cAMP-binding protein